MQEKGHDRSGRILAEDEGGHLVGFPISKKREQMGQIYVE
jgi:hypothetical protein